MQSLLTGSCVRSREETRRHRPAVQQRGHRRRSRQVLPRCVRISFDFATSTADTSSSTLLCWCRTGAEYEKILKVNVLGPFLMTTHFLPLLRKQQSRVVVNMSSGLGSISGNRMGITNPDKNPYANRWVAYNSSSEYCTRMLFCTSCCL